MVKLLGDLYAGAKGRFLRAGLTTLAGLLVAKYGQNEWYLSLGPLLQLAGKTLRDKKPGYFEWLPF